MPNTTPNTSTTARTAPPADPRVIDRARGLLERAVILVDNADGVDDGAERFRQYYLAALRAAGSALAIHEPPGRPVRRRSRSAWNRIAVIAPAFAHRADHFAGLSDVRMNIESGLIRFVAEEEVADLRDRVLDLIDDVEAMVVAYEQGKLFGQVGVPHRTA